MLEAEERYTLALEESLRKNQKALRNLIEAGYAFMSPGDLRYEDRRRLTEKLEEADRVLSETENW